MKNHFFEKHDSMKTRFFSIIIILIILFFSCEKDKTEETLKKADIIGKWVNFENALDTLAIGDSIIDRTDTLWLDYRHHYKYRLKDDSIIIYYIGICEIGLDTFRTKISLFENKTELSIDSFSNYFPKINGFIYRKIKY
jgi:hypothetical protein